jgi:hypothetical protein
MFSSSRFQALGFRFDVSAPAPETIACCERLFAHFAVPSRARIHHYVVGETQDPTSGFELSLDGELVNRSTDPERLVVEIAVDANRRAVVSSSALTLHAGGVERGGAGFVFPGVSEAGKSTLVAGLVRAGFGYLSDEAVPFDWRTRSIRPYPKPLALDRGSWSLFPELEPTLCAASEDQWLVPLDDGTVGRPCRAAVVAFPRYEAGSVTELRQLRGAEALVELAKNTFRFDALGRRALRGLASIVREVDSYWLQIGDLDEACGLVEQLAGEVFARVGTR